MTGVTGDVRLREAVASDWQAISDLQVASWQFAYRGIVADAYLDHEVQAERDALWRARFTGAISSDQFTILAEPFVAGEPGPPVAFCCILGAYDGWGSLVDNLHVRPGALRQRLGRRVFREAAALMIGTRHAATPLHLTVLEKNERAKAAYQRWHGREVERPTKTYPNGEVFPLRRYLWDSPAALVACLDRVA